MTPISLYNIVNDKNFCGVSFIIERADRRLRAGMIRKIKKYFRIAAFVTALSVILQSVYVRAAEEEPVPTGPDRAMDAAAAPAVVAEGAILMDIDTGVILYEKNIHERYYPASITKLLTCLVAWENSELTDIVTFSHQAVFGIEKGSSHIGIEEGEQLTMKDCYYAALLTSANEVSAGMAEHIGGSIEGFAAMMNEKVAELGGSDSHFVNANGLHDDDHYTSAYDMALIAQAFAKNDMLLEISGTVFYHIDATPTQPDEIDLRNHHRMLPGCQLSRTRPYEYTIGGKTGFTTAALNTLVTFAKKDGHRLVCVLLKDTYPQHYTDTLDLLEYGFACYDDPSVKAQIDAKAEELAPEQTAQEEESAGEDTLEGLTPEETEGQPEEAQEGGAAIETGADAAANIDENSTANADGFSALTIIVILVVLAAAAVCGAIFYQSYRREQERKRRRAEIMARHRARRGD